MNPRALTPLAIFNFWARKSPLNQQFLTVPQQLGLPWWLRRYTICLQCRICRFNPWVEKNPGEENGKPLQYFCLENSMDRGACWATVLLLLLLSRFSRVRLCATPETAAHQAPLSLGFSRQEHWSRLPFPSPMQESEKWKWSRSVASNSSRPHGLQPTRLLHPWDFPGKSTGVGFHCLLRGYSPWGHKESDMTEQLTPAA